MEEKWFLLIIGDEKTVLSPDSCMPRLYFLTSDDSCQKINNFINEDTRPGQFCKVNHAILIIRILPNQAL